MSLRVSRRRMLQASATGGALVAVGRHRGTGATPIANVESIKVISWQPNLYHGWPTVARRKNGQLWLVWSGGRESHVCPFGRVESMVSHDNGESWTWPRVLYDGPLDDRDSGVLETAKGTLLVTTFTSLAYEDRTLAPAEKRLAESGSAGMPKERLERWRAARDRITRKERESQLGCWMLRSIDGGISWSTPYRSLVNSPHGPIQLADGRILYAGKNVDRRKSEPPFIGVCESTDDGKSWRKLAAIPARDGDSLESYHELHAVETKTGRIVVQIRNHNRANAGETLQTESADGGKTWSTPRSIGVWGLPSHLLRLGDGRLLMTYGYRRRPYGNQARVSEDEGRTWSEPLILSADGAGIDLGYPSTVELDGGSLLTVWYENMKDSPKAVLRQARWKLDSR